MLGRIRRPARASGCHQQAGSSHRHRRRKRVSPGCGSKGGIVSARADVWLQTLSYEPYCPNPKYETRNTKQIRNSKTEKGNRRTQLKSPGSCNSGIGISKFAFVSDFD